MRSARQRAHLLSAPAPHVVAVARHLAATQAQEFWGGRWALAVRSAGDPTLRDVDAAFERGDLIRSWTQRGTVHILDPRDLEWMLSITAERQSRQAASIHRGLGLDEGDALARCEAPVRAALRGGNRLTRAELAEVLRTSGVDTTGIRGNLILTALCRRAVIVLGPVIPREGAPTREQYLVAADEWITDAMTPADPLAELLLRYLRGHGPATLADFRWWAGLPQGLARTAQEGAADRVAEIDEGVFVETGADVAARPVTGVADAARPAAVPAGILALPPFDEYYLSYADRTVVCGPDLAAAIGPTRNGAVSPVLMDASGAVVGTWKHSLAVGRHHLAPVAEVVAPGVDENAVTAALERFRAFLGD